MKPFNVRVYGLLLDSSKTSILLADESYSGHHFTKFPGGGLEFGEGTIEGLQREFIEELGISVVVESHFYTTDFFVRSAFNEKEQIISIYYLVSSAEIDQRDLSQFRKRNLSFRWKSIEELSVSDVTFPIDKKVVSILLGEK